MDKKNINCTNPNNHTAVDFKWNSLDRNKRIRRAMREFLLRDGVDYFVTANFNRETNYTASRNILRKWHAHIDRKLLGKNWWKKQSAERTYFMAFAEHPSSNLHYHLLVRLPDAEKRVRFQSLAEEQWLEMVESGSMDVQPLEEDLSVEKATNYAIKELWQSDMLENFILSTEFANN